MRKRISIPATILILLISGLLQTTAQDPKDTVRSGPKTYALIMGISNYRYIRPLNFADSDAELFKDFLKSPTGGMLHDSTIYFLKNENAKQANFWIKGLAWLTTKNLQKGDKLYVYLAGHGDAINEDEFFFLTYDCNPAGDKNNYLLTGTVQLYNLKAKMKRFVQKGVDVVFIMDACRTNELPGGNDGQQILSQAITEQKVGDIMMLAASAGQESLEDGGIGTGHGLFTYYLVDGLSGMADNIGVPDGQISLAELKQYVSKSVSELAEGKYRRKQNPVFCCDQDNLKILSKVDTGFLRKWILSKQLKGHIYSNENSLAGGKVKTRNVSDLADPDFTEFLISYNRVLNELTRSVNKVQYKRKVFTKETISADTTILDYYNSFNQALKELNLSGNAFSAENYYQRLSRIAPTSSYTLDAKLSLAAEFINFAQSKVNLYLEGRDVSAIQRIRSQLDADDKSEESGSSLDRMEKVARRDFSEVGQMVEKAIALLASEEEEDNSYTRSLQAMTFFFKANGYFEKSGDKRIDLRQAIQFAHAAYKAEPRAGYILNTMASLQLDNNRPDSTIFYGKKGIAAAPMWRYPYINVANAFMRINKPDSALKYFRKAVEVAPYSADAYVDLGFFYFQQRKFDSAKVYYEKALQLDPDNVYANNNMGWLQKEYRQFTAALSHFRKSLTADPEFFNAYNGISRVFTDMRMFDSARIYYERAAANYPDKLITNNYLGQFFQEINQFDSAKVYYRQAAVFDPNYDAPFINLGKLYAQAKQYDSAKYFYFKAIDLNNRNFRGYNQLGLLFTQMKVFDSAHFWLKKAIQVNPDNTIVLNNIGLAYSEEKKSDSAARYFRRVIQIQPENPYAYNNLGVVFFDQKKFDSAMMYYTKALEYKADLSSALINMGLISTNRKQYDNAKYYLKKVVDVHPENTVALDYLEMVFKQLNEYDSAIYYYSRAVNKNVRSTFVFNNLGRLFFDSEKFDSAVHYYFRALDMDVNDASGYNNLGFVYYRLQQYDSAVAFYTKALQREPENFNANYYLGLVCDDLGKFDSAIVYIKKAIMINPKTPAPYYYLAASYGAINKMEEALLYLRQALERGYNNYEYIIAEKSLDGIRKFPAYKAMMKKYFPKKYKPEDDN